MRETTIFDVVKQLELDNFCDLMFGIIQDIGTQGGLKNALQTEITEEELQRINDAALMEGHHLLKEVGERYVRCRSCGNEMNGKGNFCTKCGTKLKKTCNCWVKKKDNYDCGNDSCPGYGLFKIEKLKSN